MSTDEDFITGDEASSTSVGHPSFGSGEDDAEETLVTKEGLTKLREELELLKTVRRKEVAQRLKEAISYGDLSENSEYEEAKNEQAFVEGRILNLERKIKSARIIVGKEGKIGREANIGSSVTLRDISDDATEEEEMMYTIVGATEADPFARRISNESPIGRALLLHSKGDQVIVQTPSGVQKFEIIKVA